MCKCKEKSNINGNLSKIKAFCTNCNQALIGVNGEKLPLHLIPVSVVEPQVVLWREQGYDIVTSEHR